jgi:hypothetical protein
MLAAVWSMPALAQRRVPPAELVDGIKETGIACPDQLKPSLLDEAAGTETAAR